MKLKRLDPIYVVALSIAAMMILFPPWYKRSMVGEFIGIRPLFAPPVYEINIPELPSRLPPTASLRERIAERRALLELRHLKGRIGFGMLVTELLALAVVTFTAVTLRRARAERGSTPAPPSIQ